MATRMIRILALVGALGLAACVPTYTLVPSGPHEVGKTGFSVNPSSAWNKIPKGPNDIPLEESWTKNGPLLDSISFVGGLPDGQALLVQKKTADQQVPVFRADMSPNGLVSMAESYYRIRGGITVFNVTAVEPTQFLGANAVKFDFDYVGTDQLPRKGRCVMGVVDGKLYLMKLEGAASHYFNSATGEFDTMAKTAALART
jgi:hypothetical protein